MALINLVSTWSLEFAIAATATEYGWHFIEVGTVSTGESIRLFWLATLGAGFTALGIWVVTYQEPPVVTGCGKDAMYGRAVAELEAATREIHHGRYEAANERLKREISAFGSGPRTETMNDDTFLKLAMADLHERSGDLRLATMRRHGVLFGRTEMYRNLCSS